MKKTRVLALTTALALTLGLSNAWAQFVDSNATPTVTTVKSVLKNGKDDQWVVLEGKIVKRIKDDDYRFQDSTGTIEVEIDDDVFKGQIVNPSTLIRIEGEVDTEMMSDNKVEVERLYVIR